MLHEICILRPEQTPQWTRRLEGVEGQGSGDETWMMSMMDSLAVTMVAFTITTLLKLPVPFNLRVLISFSHTTHSA